ncbi:MAG TPA: VWA domain-containing protein [Candidatus Angelobacter sp.]|nr:VWA domain-containing protein [Candidatus Angelobacter sp.]
MKSSNSFTLVSRLQLIWILALILVFGLSGEQILAQSQPATPPQDTQKDNQKSGQQQNSVPEAGGPEGDIGPIAVPKKKDEAPKKEEAPRAPKKVEGMPETTLHIASNLVTVDVGVLGKDGTFIPGLKQENFKIFEDGVQQTISSFNQTQAPITAVMLVEFANNDIFYGFEYDSLVASYTFVGGLKKEDWIALVTYDLKTRIVQDFTQDKQALQGSLSILQPGMSLSAETNLFDALYDTIDRLDGVEGRKYIILVSSGRDTFSKRTLDQVLKKVQASKDIAIYSISTGQALRNYLESRGALRYLCPITDFSCSTTYAQADNQLRSFAKMTGGKYYQPLFQASFRDAFGDIAQTIRNQYTIAYHPSNRSQDGSFRKIKVQLVNPDGTPAKLRDQKGKDIKYQVIAREGYKAKPEVE